MNPVGKRAVIVTPGPPDLPAGNRTTARRWSGLLAELGWSAQTSAEYRDQPADLLVALHASRSAPSIRRFRERCPASPLIVALTGTDVYHDQGLCDDALRSLDLASRLIVLHPLATRAVPARFRSKVHVILQSVTAIRDVPPPASERFEVCVLGNLRRVKDPFRAAEAARLLPRESRVRVVHAGYALEAGMEQRAMLEQKTNPRYVWLGGLAGEAALRRLACSRLLVLPSLAEGAANVLSEAIVHGVPVLASRIPGSVGLLGEGYAGYFPVGDTEALAAALGRAETDSSFLARLRDHCRALAGGFTREAELRSWSQLLDRLR